MAQTIRIAAIDPHTGYVWGEHRVNQGLSCLTAMRQAAKSIMTNADGSREYVAEWFAECVETDTEATLHLYEIGGDFPIDDGQDQATIDAVCAGRLMGSVRYCPEN